MTRVLAGVTVMAMLLGACGARAEEGSSSALDAADLEAAVDSLLAEPFSYELIASERKARAFTVEGDVDASTATSVVERSVRDPEPYSMASIVFIEERIVEGDAFVRFGPSSSCWVSLADRPSFQGSTALEEDALVGMLRTAEPDPALESTAVDLPATVPLPRLMAVLASPVGRQGPVADVAVDVRVPVSVRVGDGVVTGVTARIGEVVGAADEAGVEVETVFGTWLEREALDALDRFSISFGSLALGVDVDRPSRDRLFGESACPGSPEALGPE